LINRNPTQANGSITPQGKYLGKKPSINHLKFYGCVSFYHIPKESRKKMDSKS
jgi:hypothetical protein